VTLQVLGGHAESENRRGNARGEGDSLQDFPEWWKREEEEASQVPPEPLLRSLPAPTKALPQRGGEEKDTQP